MTQTQNTIVAPEPEPAVDESAATSHLINLPHMSATAGVGTQEYVAINAASIMALIFGIGSILAIFSPLLLIVPIACVIISLISERQIKNSNGTETGLGLAYIGLFLSLAVGSGVIAGNLVQWFQNRSDQAAINHILVGFGQSIGAHNYAEAYLMLSLHFKARVPESTFTNGFRSAEEEGARNAKLGGIGGITGTAWNSPVQIVHETETGTVLANTSVDFQYAGAANPWEQPVRLRKSADSWFIDSLPTFFPEQTKH